jgi:hypothetical protein
MMPARSRRGSRRPTRTQGTPALSSGERRQGDPGSEGGGVRQRANDALTNLSMYALTLDVEYHRLDDRLLELAKTDPGTAELGRLLRERDEIAAEREAFRRAVLALREQLPLGPARGR